MMRLAPQHAARLLVLALRRIEFHGNQWTAGGGEGGGITKRPDGAPIVQHPVAGSIAEGRGIKIGSRVSYSYRAPGEDMGKRGSGKVVGFVSNNGRDKGSVQDVVIRDGDEIKFVAEKNVRTSIRTAGDVEGHEFHGNQWTEGQGRDENGLNRGTGQRVETGGGWRESPTGERPYDGVKEDRGSDWKGTDSDHVVVRDNGLWGSSHSGSQAITGAAAKQMGIEGYRDNGNDDVEKVADRFLNAIAEDNVGAPEVLHHSFENVAHTEFTPGDIVRLPLTATSGNAGSYGIRSDADSQRGQPVVFEFEKGTQMAGYSRWKPADAKEFGYVWGEALVAGGFKVKSVREAYMGSQHFNQFYAKPENKDKTIQIYGKVVRLEQTESFHPKEGWSKRG
jgi:hypothetical protein